MVQRLTSSEAAQGGKVGEAKRFFDLFAPPKQEALEEEINESLKFDEVYKYLWTVYDVWCRHLQGC